MRSGMAQGVVVMREWKIKGATSQFAHIEKFSFYFSNLSFAIRVSFLHPLLSLFRYSCCGASVASEQQHKRYSQKNQVVVCGPLPKSPTLFMTKICDFPYPMYDLSKNLIPYS